MRISPVSYNSTIKFRGKTERDDFRQSAREVLKELKDIKPGAREYSAFDESGSSPRFRLIDTLFYKTNKVGKKYAALQDKILLNKLKKAYVTYQKKEDEFGLFIGGGPFKDREKEVHDIKF